MIEEVSMLSSSEVPSMLLPIISVMAFVVEDVPSNIPLVTLPYGE